MKYGFVVYVISDPSCETGVTVDYVESTAPLPPSAVVVHAADNEGGCVNLNNYPEDSETGRMIKAKIHRGNQFMFLMRASGYPDQK